MTDKEALEALKGRYADKSWIDILDHVQDTSVWEKAIEALEKAEEYRWRKVEDEHPEKETSVIVREKHIKTGIIYYGLGKLKADGTWIVAISEAGFPEGTIIDEFQLLAWKPIEGHE